MACRLLEEDDAVQLVRPSPAVLLGHRRTEEAGRAGLQPEVTIDVALLFVTLVIRHGLEPDEAIERVAEK